MYKRQRFRFSTPIPVSFYKWVVYLDVYYNSLTVDTCWCVYTKLWSKSVTRLGLLLWTCQQTNWLSDVNLWNLYKQENRNFLLTERSKKPQDTNLGVTQGPRIGTLLILLFNSEQSLLLPNYLLTNPHVCFVPTQRNKWRKDLSRYCTIFFSKTS